MPDERMARVEAIVDAALARPLAEREEFVRKACSVDTDLCDEVLSLIAQAPSIEHFLESAPDLDGAPLAVGLRLGRYEIVSAVEGGGNMGEVYRARDTRLPRTVAIKILPPHSRTDPGVLARFKREADAIGALNHPHICTLYDVGRHADIDFLVMEYIEGETLRQRLRRGRLSVEDAVQVAGQVADALAATHHLSLTHRDIKPSNIMITPEGYVKVVDFGLARLASSFSSHAPTGKDATEAGSIVGTVGYMSPEQARGLPLDQRTDIFSLGVVIFECLTGRLPFDGESRDEYLLQLLSREPHSIGELVNGVPADLQDLVARCLERDQANRLNSAAQLSTELKRISERPKPASPWRYISIAGAAAAVAVAAVWQWGSTDSSFQQLTVGRARIGAARFAYGDKAVIYSEATGSHDMDISRFDLGTSPLSRSLNYPAGTDLLATRDADLALLLAPMFVQGERFVGTLAVPTLGGAPQEIGTNVECADWSGPNELAVVVSTVTGTGENRIEFPQHHTVYVTTNVIRFLRVSPDKQRVAFIEEKMPRRSPSGIISIVDRNQKRTRLTGEWGNARGLAWSTDGQEIWFTAGKQGANRALRAVTLAGKDRVVFEAPGSLTLWDIAGDGRVLLTRDEERLAVIAKLKGEELERDFSWSAQSGLAAISRDGRSLLGGDQSGVYVRRTNERRPQLLTMTRDTWADDLSPDGNTVLGTTYSGRLVLVPTGGGVPQLVPNHSIVEYRGAYWFPDGRQVLFNGRQNGEGTRSYVQDITDGSAPRPITPVGQWGVAISPKGDWIAGPSVKNSIPLWPVNEGEQKSVPGTQDGERPVGWSEDGNWVWLFRRGEIPAAISKLNINTGQRELWKTLIPPDSAGVYSIVDFMITPDGKAYVYSYFQSLSQLFLVHGLK